MLYGRDAERAQLTSLVEAARSGMSSAIVVRGEAGVGKSSLIEDVASAAKGTRSLRAVGVESESELAFAGLHQLLAPLLRDLDALLPPRRSALGAAMGLVEASGTPDRFLVAAAVLDLLASGAEDGPLLAVVDDAQWIDGASQDALLFVARRLGLDGIVLVFGAREGDASRFEARGLTSLELQGLDVPAAAALIEDRSGVAPTTAVAARLVAATHGNPLAVAEIATAVDDDALRGETPLPDPLPLARGVEAAFADRIAALSDATRTMLLLAALEPESDPGLLARAGAGLGAGVDDLEPAELAGVVRVEPSRVTFGHPLLRSAVDAGATFAQRRRAHLALAASLPAADVDRRAWHAASAAVEPDEAVAAELERLGRRARERAGNAAAQAAFSRAAELSPAPADRGSRLVSAAQAAWDAGRGPEAIALLDRAAPDVQDERDRVRLDHLRGVIALRTGALAEGRRMLMDAASRAAAIDVDGAVRMLGDAARTGAFAGNRAWIADAAQALEALPDPETDGARLIRMMVRSVGAIIAGDVAGGTDGLREALPLAEQSEDVQIAEYGIAAAWMIGDTELATRLLTATEAAARERAAIATLPQLLILRAAAENDAGRFAAALSAADEGAALAREAGQLAPLAACLSHTAWAAAIRGDAALATRAAAEGAALGTQLGLLLATAVAAFANAMNEIGGGRDETAVEILSGVEHPLFAPRRAAETCEALARLGRTAGAGEALDVLEHVAAATKLPVNEAVLERCRGLLAEAGGDAHFERALALHGDVRPFERARTELAYGEALRRARRRTDARAPLRRALESFERMGAEPWAARADRELRATGESSRRRDRSAVDSLTPQELTICRLVAEGLSNPEIAARLFLSRRTIEYHLHKVFPKLGVASRVELVKLELGDDRAAPVPVAT